ncbi:MAG: GTP-binding protein, partial [Planctomycetota bacterium]
MAKYDTKDIRNVALVGHNDSGKTSLAEALLFKTGATSRLGSVDEGTTVFDHEPGEQERNVSIDLAVASARHDGREINVFDAPGYSDFSGEAVSALHAAETAFLCIHATTGIMVNTRKMWQRAVDRGMARVICITKMDSPNTDYPGLVGAIREAFGKECVPVLLPVGSGDGFSGVVNILEKAEGVPDELSSLADEAREKVMEADDALLEKYLEGADVSSEEVSKILPKAIQEGRVVPILCTSVEKDAGIAETLDFIAKFLPSPVDAGAREADVPGKEDKVSLDPSSSAALAAQVFKTVADPFVGRLSFVRVFSGKARGEQNVFNQRTGKSSRVGKFYKPFGKEERPLPEAVAGDVFCVTKVDDLRVGDTICDPGTPVRLAAPRFPMPMVGLAVEPESKKDLARLSESLQKMAESDPTFKFTRDAQTG